MTETIRRRLPVRRGALSRIGRCIENAPSICHCRMCQKAFGYFFGPLVGAPKTDVEWTRGQPIDFQ